jgi:hypothetical protein
MLKDVWVPLIAALIAFIGVWYSVLSNRKETDKKSKQEHDDRARALELEKKDQNLETIKLVIDGLTMTRANLIEELRFKNRKLSECEQERSRLRRRGKLRKKTYK